MTDWLPMFPLNTVVFPGTTLPLRIFEDRYRALVAELLDTQPPIDRLFGTVGIREGYEVGEHGAQSVYRVGCRLQLTEVTSHRDGSYTVEAVARDRIRLQSLQLGGAFPVGEIEELTDASTVIAEETRTRAVRAVADYREVAAQVLGETPADADLPLDPEWFSWSVAGQAPLPMAERQAVLECEDAEDRVRMVTELLRAEIQAVRAIPSLPATDVARTRWSPN